MDIILADYTFSFDGLSASKITRKNVRMCLSSLFLERWAKKWRLDALKIGATDYILKERVSRILPSVHRALREAKERAERNARKHCWQEEKRLLKMIAKGNSPLMILDALCRLVEELSKGSLSSILLSDSDGKRLWHGAAPSLPKSYTDAIDGGFIGPAVESLQRPLTAKNR